MKEIDSETSEEFATIGYHQYDCRLVVHEVPFLKTLGDISGHSKEVLFVCAKSNISKFSSFNLKRRMQEENIKN
jgi:hypothetical protein